jgi:arylesterase / paraoxonase
MVSSRTILSSSVVVVSILAWCFANLTTILEAVGARATIDKTRLVRWENSSALSNGECTVDTLANACEDVKIHFASSTAFLACGDPEERTRWYPPACIRTTERRSTFRETLFKYDIESATTTQLRIHGLDGDFVTHGIDVQPHPDDVSKVHLFAVNHARAGDSIVIFEHQLGTSSVRVVRDVRHPNLYAANGVAATGPW